MGEYDPDQARKASIVVHYCGDHRLSTGLSHMRLEILVHELARRLNLTNPLFDGHRTPGASFIWHPDPQDKEHAEDIAAARRGIETYRHRLSRGEYAFASLHEDCGCIGNRERDYYVLLLWKQMLHMQVSLRSQIVPGAILVKNDDKVVTGGETFTSSELCTEVLGIIALKPMLARELHMNATTVQVDADYLQVAHEEIRLKGLIEVVRQVHLHDDRPGPIVQA